MSAKKQNNRNGFFANPDVNKISTFSISSTLATGESPVDVANALFSTWKAGKPDSWVLIGVQFAFGVPDFDGNLCSGFMALYVNTSTLPF